MTLETHSPLRQPRYRAVATPAYEQGSTLPALLLATGRRLASRPAFTHMGRTLTYADIDAASAALATYLRRDLALAPGARVAIMLPNLLQFPVALLGVQRADLVAVPVNPLYTPRELKHQLKDSGAECLIVLENFGAVAAASLDGTAVKHVVTTRVGDMLGALKGFVTDFVLRHVKKAVLPARIREARQIRGGTLRR